LGRALGPLRRDGAARTSPESTPVRRPRAYNRRQSFSVPWIKSYSKICENSYALHCFLAWRNGVDRPPDTPLSAAGREHCFPAHAALKPPTAHGLATIVRRHPYLPKVRDYCVPRPVRLLLKRFAQSTIDSVRSSIRTRHAVEVTSKPDDASRPPHLR